MNIDKWLYPKPKVTWRLEDHLGEIIWIPVFQEHRSQPKAAAQLVDLQEYCSKENNDTSFFGLGFQKLFGWGGDNKSVSGDRDTRQSATKSKQSGEQPTSEQQAIMIKELNAVYSNSLGVSERQVAHSFEQKDDVSPLVQGIARFHPKNLQTDTYRQSQFGFGDAPGNVSYTQQSTMSESHGDTVTFSSRPSPFGLTSTPPTDHGNRHPRYSIPCLFLRQNMFQTKVLLYFHSNAEDIHLSEWNVESDCVWWNR